MYKLLLLINNNITEQALVVHYATNNVEYLKFYLQDKAYVIAFRTFLQLIYSTPRQT